MNTDDLENQINDLLIELGFEKYSRDIAFNIMELVELFIKTKNNEITQQMKEKLQFYWVNELHLPIQIQTKSMAYIDLVFENEYKELVE